MRSESVKALRIAPVEKTLLPSISLLWYGALRFSSAVLERCSRDRRGSFFGVVPLHRVSRGALFSMGRGPAKGSFVLSEFWRYPHLWITVCVSPGGGPVRENTRA